MGFDVAARQQNVPDRMLGYRTGTFTPTITFGGNSVGIAYALQQGFYTVIGDRLFFNCRITLSAKGSSTGAALIKTNLAAALFAVENAACSIKLSAVAANAAEKHVQCDVVGGTADLRPGEIGTSSVDADVQYTHAEFTDTSTLTISGQWRIAR